MATKSRIKFQGLACANVQSVTTHNGASREWLLHAAQAPCTGSTQHCHRMSANRLMLHPTTTTFLPAATCSPPQTRGLQSSIHTAAEDEPSLDALIAQVRQLPAGPATTAAAEARTQLDGELLPLQLRAQHHLAALQAGAQAVNLQSLPSDSQQLSIGGASTAHVFSSRQTEVGGMEAACMALAVAALQRCLAFLPGRRHISRAAGCLICGTAPTCCHRSTANTTSTDSHCCFVWLLAADAAESSPATMQAQPPRA